MQISALVGRLRDSILWAADRYTNGQHHTLRHLRTWLTDQPNRRWRTVLGRHLGLLLGLAAAGAGGRSGIGLLVGIWIAASLWNYVPPPTADEIARRRDLTLILEAMGRDQGIHVSALHDLVRCDDSGEEVLPYMEFKQRLEWLGLPVRRSVRTMTGVRTGVHRDDVEALLRGEKPLPSPTVRRSKKPVEGPVELDVEQLRAMGRHPRGRGSRS